jgi:hypothetical protein
LFVLRGLTPSFRFTPNFFRQKDNRDSVRCCKLEMRVLSFMLTVREKESVINREHVNWLLQTIKDAEDAEGFVLAQYECGRISLEVMTDVAREQGRINRTANQFLTTATRRSTEYATTELSSAVA